MNHGMVLFKTKCVKIKKKGREKMEKLDIYDEHGNHLGAEDRDIVHRDALWHKTVHCWLYDKNGNIFFQIRKDRGTLYTTASGHLMAGETIQEGFQREIREEIGILIDSSDAELIEVIPFILDRVKEDGSMFRDRVFANVYIDLYEGNLKDFQMDEKEINGLVLVNAKETLDLFQKGTGTIKGSRIDLKNNVEEVELDISEFLVNDGETLLGKYGKILESVIAHN